MSTPYLPNGGVIHVSGIDTDPWVRMDQSRQTHSMQIAVKHTVHLAIGEVEGGYLLSISNGPLQLCFGAESIEAGVRAVLTHLVTQGLEK